MCTIVSSPVIKNACVYTVECILPPGLTIGKSCHGLGVFSTHQFLKGQILYTGIYQTVEDVGEGIIILKTNTGIYVLDSRKHSTLQADGTRHLYSFDSYTNHSCSPNTYSADEQHHDTGGTYKTVALCDIMPGDEITCDYDLYELDSRDMGITECRCESPNCRRQAIGFMHWPEEQQIPMLARLEDHLLTHWREQHPRIFLRAVAAPAGLGIARSGDGDDLTLIATRDFAAGEIVFTNPVEYLDSASYDAIIVIAELVNPPPDPADPAPPAPATNAAAAITAGTAGGAEFWAEPERVVRVLGRTHTVRRGGGAVREFFGFDSFGDHACDPNTAIQYAPAPAPGGGGEGAVAVSTARRAIAAGERVTCDYALYADADGGAESSFACACGAPCCRRVVHE